MHIIVQDSDNDVVRCRWAGTDECESICDGFPNATLDANKVCALINVRDSIEEEKITCTFLEYLGSK